MSHTEEAVRAAELPLTISTEDHERYHMRKLLTSEQEIGHLFVIDRQIRIGAATLCCGGIGGVETRPEFRMKGHMRKLLDENNDYMRAQGYDISILFGIRDFYHKFGYAPIMPDYRLVLETRNAEAAPRHDGYQLRPFEPTDAAAVLNIHQATNMLSPGMVVRDPAHFSGFSMGSGFGVGAQAVVILDARQQIVGYAVYDQKPREVTVVEVGATSPRLFDVLLHHFAEMAIKFRCEHLQFVLPPDHPFAAYCRRYGATLTVTYPRCEGGMARIMNQQATLEKLQPEFAARVQNSPFADRQVAVALETELGRTVITTGSPVRVSADGPAQDTVRLPQSVLMQLLVGYRPASDALLDERVDGAPEAVELLATLFPTRWPYMWWPDRF